MTPAGQDHGAGMPGEIAYALQKGAPASVARSLATALAEPAVTVNPVPSGTGYLTGEAYDAVAPMFPAGRWGMPDDPARLIAWLATDEAIGVSPARTWARAWGRTTGQVIDSGGGFRR
jgi:3-oxoacyl-[acyl-carrier protein] reductase